MSAAGKRWAHRESSDVITCRVERILLVGPYVALVARVCGLAIAAAVGAVRYEHAAHISARQRRPAPPSRLRTTRRSASGFAFIGYTARRAGSSVIRGTTVRARHDLVGSHVQADVTSARADESG